MFFWPAETFLQLIIGFIWLVALYVLFRFVKVWHKAQLNFTVLETISNPVAVSFLEQSLRQNKVNPIDFYDNYEKSNLEPGSEELFEHLRAIFVAGCKSSRLDSDLLIKNTVNKMFAGVEVIRTCISLFLVIGILGTLVGLAISIGSFSGNNFATTGAASAEFLKAASTQLSNLFSNLKGAFAPSMWGVAFTIIFVLAYTIFIQEKCINSMTEKLTISTIKIWLPSLYPTDIQKSENSMVKLKDTIQNADAINSGANKLLTSLEDSNAAVASLKQMAENMKASATQFDQSVVRINEMQTKVAEASGNLDERYARIEELIRNALGVADFQALQEVIKTLKVYDEKQFGVQNRSNEQIQGLIQESRDSVAQLSGAVGEIATRNKQLVQEVGEPIQEQLRELVRRLEECATAIEHMKDPLGNMDAKISELFDRTLRYMESIVRKSATASGIAAGGIAATDAVVSIDTKDLEGKLEGILKFLKENKPKEAQKPTFMDNLRPYLVAAMTLALIVSIGVQIGMLFKIRDIESAQAKTNQTIVTELKKNEAQAAKAAKAKLEAQKKAQAATKAEAEEKVKVKADDAPVENKIDRAN